MLPPEVREALSRLRTPCESDRWPPHYVCDEEATHTTPSGVFLCAEHAERHNERVRSNRFIKPDKLDRYLAVPLSRNGEIEPA